MTVRVERREPVTTVVLARPSAANAVDRATALALADALSLRLANRVVPSGTCREAAEQLALELARSPRDCLRPDRRSAYEGLELSSEAALANELEHGLASLRAGAAEGAARFAGGEGRHGAF